MPRLAYSHAVLDNLVPVRAVEWLGDSRERLRQFPKAVRTDVGFALYRAQIGAKAPNAKPLAGFGGGVLEVVSDHRGDTFRAVYTVRVAGTIYVLHVFQKKSTHGIATPKREMDLVKRRLREALESRRVRES